MISFAPARPDVKPAFVILFSPAMVLRNPAFGCEIAPARRERRAPHSAADLEAAKGPCPADAPTIGEACERFLSTTLSASDWAALKADLRDDGRPVVWIGGRGYAVAPIPAGECGSRAFRLTKADGTTYDVIRTVHGTVECDCGDYTFRHENTNRACKHGAALIDAAMLAPPRPRMTPALAPVGRVRDEFDEGR